MGLVIDPIKFMRMMWPKIQLYDKQVEVIYSFANNDETVVPAKDVECQL